MDWAARTVLSAVAGVLMYGAFPPRSWWFCAVISIALLYMVLTIGRPRVRTGAWLGFVFGLGFFVPLLPWIGEYVGPLPWLALATVLAVYQALFGAIAVLTTRLPCPPIWFTASWLLVEALRSGFPFGGFPWGRVAFSQVDGPLLPLASVFGAPGVSGAVALFGSGVAWLVAVLIHAYRADGRTDGPGIRVAAFAVVVALLAPMAAIALTPATLDRNVSSSSTKIAAIQGNVPRLGLEFNAQRRAVLDNHVRTTFALAQAVNTGRAERPDMVFWPENASDISPLDNSDAAAEITAASVAVGAPILVGTLLRNGDGRPTNTVLVWDQQRGPVDRYDKHIVQPFGEYLPWRPFFRMFSSYADLAGNFRPGEGRSAVTVPTASGTVDVGIATCWEVAFDRAARDAVDDGAQILFVPTNNATFGRSTMTYQQLAMSQLRAVEHGRAVVVAATSGVSALVEPDGTVASQSGIFRPAILASRLPLHEGKTMATRLGAWPQAVAVIVALVGLLFAIGWRTRFTVGNGVVRRPHEDAHTASGTKELDGSGD
ncbi:apolipoprotein N-acyltransferase [Gordonia sp. ABSL49_1]|uniref:apolipoprotein N-acyltransferase n=1 Tax=Gordonia sp. ABSL49_1 TaxID=2920941 RepID=UPI001F10F4E4|nr:apolipoprotein N-acyltransferase [Gordonia sp. ABSL49_1]MCH5642773.1 apolipoprotein N-acyltransferase [Gordonia sp. ABSL49_1]